MKRLLGLVLAGLVGAGTLFSGIVAAGNFQPETVNADVLKYPVEIKTVLRENMGWTSKDPSILDNMEIKLYKLDIERFKEIIDEHGGMFITASTAGIYNQAISEAQLVDKWSLSESNHITDLSGGDYFLSKHDSLCGENPPYPYFSISNDGKKMNSYAIGGNKDSITSTTIYEEGSTGTSRTIDVNVSSPDLVAKYIDPIIHIYDSSGNNITNKCKVDFYKKDNMGLNRTTGTDVSIFHGIQNNDAITAALEHPATHIIRCVSVPLGYKKFDDVTLEITNKTDIDGRDQGWPHLEIDANCKSYADWELYEPDIWYRQAKPAVIKITLEDAVMADSVQLNKSTLTLNEGKYEYLTATVLPKDTYDKTVTWSSSNENVATVGYGGKVTAVNAGTTEITAETNNGKTATCKVTVNPAPDGIQINESTLTLEERKSETLTATVLPDDAYDKTVTWSSSDTNVATVDKNTGKVTAVKAGMATITAKTVNGKTAECDVRVNSSTRKFDPLIDGNSFKHSSNSKNSTSGFVGRENYQFYVGSQQSQQRKYIKSLFDAFSENQFEIGDCLDFMYSNWGGSCYGISAVMGLKYTDHIKSEWLSNNGDTTFYDSGKPCDNEKLDDYINFYINLQGVINKQDNLKLKANYNEDGFWAALGQDQAWFLGDFLDELVSSIKQGKCLLLGFGAKFHDNENYNHAVLLTGIDYEDDEKIEICLYDPNTVDDYTDGEMTKLIIYKGYNRNKQKFEFYINSERKIDNNNYKFMSIIDMDDFPRLNADNNKLENFSPVTNKHWNLSVNSNNEYTITDGKDTYELTEGLIQGKQVYDIQPKYTESLDGSSVNNRNYTLGIDKASEYIISDIKTDVNISLGDSDNYYSIKGSGIDEIVVKPDEGITIKGDEMSYKVMLNTKDKINENEKGIIEIEGKGKKEVKFTQQKDTILVDSEEDCENVSITSYLTFEPYVQLENRKGNHFVANSGTEPSAKYVQVKEVTIPEQKIELGINESYLLQPNIEPDNSTNKNIKYISSDNNIVTVDKDGNIKAIGEGGAVIQIISEDSGVKTECRVVVKKENSVIQKTDNKQSNEVTANQVSKPGEASSDSSATKTLSSNGGASTAQVVKASNAKSVVAQASKTGDTNLTALWITLSAVSAGIVTAMVVAIKKRRAE